MSQCPFSKLVKPLLLWLPALIICAMIQIGCFAALMQQDINNRYNKKYLLLTIRACHLDERAVQLRKPCGAIY
jgi:hypothetical protein